MKGAVSCFVSEFQARGADISSPLFTGHSLGVIGSAGDAGPFAFKR